MAQAYIPRHLRRAVEQAARHRCGYCLTPQAISGAALEIEHIVPVVAGGLTVEDNLWLACTSCNRYKGSPTHGHEANSGEIVPLFNPRSQRWNDHFTWNEDGTEIVGLTPCGQITIAALRMNNPEVVGARSLWVQSGW